MVHHRNRYFIVQIEWADGQAAARSSAQAVMSHVRSSIVDLHGDYGAGCTLPSLSMRFFDTSSNICALRVDREFSGMLRTAMVLVTLLNQRKARLSVLAMSGSMRKCKAVLRRCLDAHLQKRLADSTRGPLPPREREQALSAQRAAVAELDATQL
jgi:ribonuclease P/MRP protein subunit POP5